VQRIEKIRNKKRKRLCTGEAKGAGHVGKRYRGREKEDEMAGDKLQSLKLVADAVVRDMFNCEKKRDLEISQERSEISRRNMRQTEKK